ncbi:hypothetical protein C8F01DRAFT_1311131 [Mycena amicta]|nr:hypothetical protein C8F01DRAFT_1311131 [Mycena amicta]
MLPRKPSSCVRALPVDEFRAAAVGVPGLLFDGDIVNVTSAFGTFRAGNWVKVPLLVNTDEGPTFAIPGTNATNEARSAMSPLIADPTQLDQLFELYPDIPALGSQGRRISVDDDGRYIHEYTVIVGAAGIEGGAVFQVSMVYVFNTQDNKFVPSSINIPSDTPNPSTDFFLTNHGPATYLGFGAPIADRFLGVYMSRSWAAFVATGDPNNAKGSTTLSLRRVARFLVTSDRRQCQLDRFLTAAVLDPGHLFRTTFRVKATSEEMLLRLTMYTAVSARPNRSPPPIPSIATRPTLRDPTGPSESVRRTPTTDLDSITLLATLCLQVAYS